MFEFKRYSDDVLNYKTKIEGLNKLYEPLFLKFITDINSLNKNEEIIFYQGLNEISLYIVNNLLFKIRVGTNNKLDIKIATLYTKYSNMHEDVYSFSYKFSEDIFDLAKDSIYESVGIPNRKKAFKKIKSGNLISYIQNIFTYKVLNLLNNQVNAILGIGQSNSVENDELGIDEILIIEELLELKKVKYIFGEKKFNEIKKIMISGTTDIPKQLLKIFEYINKE